MDTARSSLLPHILDGLCTLLTFYGRPFFHTYWTDCVRYHVFHLTFYVRFNRSSTFVGCKVCSAQYNKSERNIAFTDLRV